MSERLGISQSSYSQIEKSDENINFEKLKLISEILEMKPLDLLNFDESHIFNNTNQQGGNAASIQINSFSDKMQELYKYKINSLEKMISKLESENSFLK